MSQNITKIKSRISSINGAYKVTSAMKLVSNVKLRTYKSKMLANRRYSQEIENSCKEIFANLLDEKSIYVDGNIDANKDLYIVVSSSLGLCGSYNSNIFKLADASIKKEDEAIILGKKGVVHFANNEFTSLPGYEDYNSIKDHRYIDLIKEYLISSFLKGEYKNIYLIYTRYVNPIKFEATLKKVLPLEIPNEKNVGYPPLLEPSKEELIKSVVPFFVESLIYSSILESEVSEQASRSNAMENATKNAEELLDNLKIEFNKARQGAITQEIIEIVGASEAV